MKTCVSDNAYYALESKISKRVPELKGSLFTTDVQSLWHMYLNGIQTEYRQHYNCNACRRFIEKYGGLVQIDKLGMMTTALWEDDAPFFFSKSIDVMHEAVLRARVSGVFLSDERIWGTPKTKDWTHLSGAPNLPRLDTKLFNANQQMAAKLEDRGILHRSLAQFNVDHVRQAVRILEADALDRSEKTLGVARWFLELSERLVGIRHHERRANIVWNAVAEAPPGFCNIRSTMIGTLLDDIKAGMEFETISERWAKKMHPLKYKRPTASITEGQVKAANAIMDKLQTAGSLQRKFAKLENCLPFWAPTPIIPLAQPIGGAFDHLLSREREQTTIDLPTVTVTWEKFREKVLNKASKIELYVPSDKASFYGLVTATYPSAPPILQWDFDDQRNPISWYFVHGGSFAVSWNLTPSTWINVNALMRRPCHWHRPELMTHHGEAIYAVLEGCRPTSRQIGGSFFPECLRSEFHSIRATMEAYSIRAEIPGHEVTTACGIALQKGDTFNIKVRVTDSNGERSEFLLDRWE